MDPGSPSPALPQSWNRFSYASNSPTSQVDRDGRLANWAIGAIAGAVIGGVGEAVRQAIAGDPVNFRDIGAAAAGGLISGAIAGGTFGASLVVEFGVGGAVVAGAVANTAGGVVQRELDSSEATSGLSGKAMMVDAVVGGVGGGAGHTVENAARTMASGEARALQASVARRQQIVDARTASNTPPMSAAQKLARDKAALAAIETRAVTKGVVVGTTTTNAAAPILVMQIPDSSTKAPGP